MKWFRGPGPLGRWTRGWAAGWWGERRPLAQTLAGWAGNAPGFEEIVAAFAVWPAVIDVASHEQDIRGAVGQPGARDTEVIRELAGWLIARLRTPVSLRVTVGGTGFQVGPGGEPVLELTTTWYEAFRWRMGRRSRRQLPPRLRAALRPPRLPRLVLPRGPRTVFTIGRSPECDLPLGDITVSWHHAELRRNEAAWVLVDLGSTNGTRVNGWRADSGFIVRAGDWVSFGRSSFRIADHG